jgi:hypothetical protein
MVRLRFTIRYSAAKTLSATAPQPSHIWKINAMLGQAETA